MSVPITITGFDPSGRVYLQCVDLLSICPPAFKAKESLWNKAACFISTNPANFKPQSWHWKSSNPEEREKQLDRLRRIINVNMVPVLRNQLIAWFLSEILTDPPNQ